MFQHDTRASAASANVGRNCHGVFPHDDASEPSLARDVACSLPHGGIQSGRQVGAVVHQDTYKEIMAARAEGNSMGTAVPARYL